MSDKRRATRYGAFFESAEKASASSTTATIRKKSPARAAPVKKEAARKSPARVETIVKKEEKKAESPVKKERKPSKSPARPRAASKGRKASKSPARVAKKEKVKKEEKEKEPKKASSKKSKTSPSIVIEKASTKQLSPKSKAKAKKVLDEIESDVDLSPRPKRRTRQDTAAERKSVSASVSHSVVNASPEYSDIDDPDISFKKRRGTSKLDEIKEFGGTIGCILLIISIPILSLVLQHLCTARDCTVRTPNWKALQTLSSYYSLEITKIAIPFIAAVGILNIFPLGRVTKVLADRGYAEYHHNGLTLCVLTIAAIHGAEYVQYPVLSKIYANLWQLQVLLVGLALVQSLLAIIRSRYVAQAHLNPFAKTGSVIQDFCIGREINPKLISSLIDIKLLNYHVSLITTVVINYILLSKNIKIGPLPPVAADAAAETTLVSLDRIQLLIAATKFQILPLVVSVLIIVYVLDLLIHEHHLSKTFELQYEGVGASLLLRYAVLPFNMSLLAKYVLEHKVTAPWYVTTIIGVVFTLSLVIKRVAIRTKHEFRLNPTSHKSLGLKTIPTFQGRRLLVDGLWKIIRQPNCIAEILIHLSLALALIGKFSAPPLLATLITIIILILRSRRIEERNSIRYESAWQRYCQEVKYVLIPRLY